VIEKAGCKLDYTPLCFMKRQGYFGDTSLEGVSSLIWFIMNKDIIIIRAFAIVLVVFGHSIIIFVRNGGCIHRNMNLTF